MSLFSGFHDTRHFAKLRRSVVTYCMRRKRIFNQITTFSAKVRYHWHRSKTYIKSTDQRSLCRAVVNVIKIIWEVSSEYSVPKVNCDRNFLSIKDIAPVWRSVTRRSEHNSSGISNNAGTDPISSKSREKRLLIERQYTLIWRHVINVQRTSDWLIDPWSLDAESLQYIAFIRVDISFSGYMKTTSNFEMWPSSLLALLPRKQTMLALPPAEASPQTSRPSDPHLLVWGRVAPVGTSRFFFTSWSIHFVVVGTWLASDVTSSRLDHAVFFSSSPHYRTCCGSQSPSLFIN